MLRVRQQLQRVDGKLAYFEPKTARSRRAVPLPDFVVASLREQRRRQVEDRLLAGSRWQESGLVFTSTIGTPLDGRNVTARLRRLLAAAGLPPMRFHDLRHGAATLLLAGGEDLRTIMEILGHSQIAVTANFYAHVTDAVQRRAADRLDAAIRPAAGAP